VGKSTRPTGRGGPEKGSTFVGKGGTAAKGGAGKAGSAGTQSAKPRQMRAYTDAVRGQPTREVLVGPVDLDRPLQQQDRNAIAMGITAAVLATVGPSVARVRSAVVRAGLVRIITDSDEGAAELRRIVVLLQRPGGSQGGPDFRIVDPREAPRPRLFLLRITE
jgi:hypothetical protein